ncbi:hypothetical protein HPB52_006254 [Rhipicephalus sanguineus]|uniref:Uncharacterized protein n=1 Tax=Rhipicephalus sanguineus TaxID=34632 RepID=A0A9D4PQH7_RHISA|nr:hypothetical protein HPB52_006254 [Rhipicephalus sanguineus]
MPGGECKFQSAWLEHSEYRHWVRPETSDPYRAKCTVCQKSVDIATMGESALKSHQKSAKHRSKVAAGEGCSSVRSFLRAENVTETTSQRESTETSSRAATLDEDCRRHGSNVPVLERALATWEHLKQYTEAMSGRRLPLRTSVGVSRDDGRLSVAVKRTLQSIIAHLGLALGAPFHPCRSSRARFLKANEQRPIRSGMLKSERLVSPHGTR